VLVAVIVSYQNLLWQRPEDIFVQVEAMPRVLALIRGCYQFQEFGKCAAGKAGALKEVKLKVHWTLLTGVKTHS